MTGRQFLYIIIATCITILIWVVLDIIQDRSRVQPPMDVQLHLEPIDPNFDKEVIDGLN